jgi:hypothetical protein
MDKPVLRKHSHMVESMSGVYPAPCNDPDCPESMPEKKVYECVDSDGDNDYLVRAVDEASAWAWLAKDWGTTVDKVKKSYTIREAVINEAA